MDNTKASLSHQIQSPILYWIDFSLLFLLVTLLNFYDPEGSFVSVSQKLRLHPKLNNNTVENIYGGSSYHKGTIVLSKLSSVLF